MCVFPIAKLPLISLRDPKSSIRLVAESVMDFTLAKQNKTNISRSSRAKSGHSSVVVDHVKTTGHNIKWDRFDVLASAKTIVFPNVNVSSEKLLRCKLFPLMVSTYVNVLMQIIGLLRSVSSVYLPDL